MSTEKQKRAARQNIKKARQANRKGSPRSSEGLGTAEKDDLRPATFAFPEERKEPLTDAKHVRRDLNPHAGQRRIPVKPYTPPHPLSSKNKPSS